MLFGQGGTAVEVIGDRAVALPPLNGALARELIVAHARVRGCWRATATGRRRSSTPWPTC